MGVCSKFSLEECRKYVEYLHTSRQGINNPGGYATKVYRNGEADEQIATFLTLPDTSAKINASQCPDCGGTGFWYPQGREQGVAKCRHEKLREGE